jgi:hypothetical protein
MTITLANSSTQNWRDRPATDFYPTPEPVTQALLDHLMLPKMLTIWEPACGEGHMVKVLRANGYVVRDSDIQTGTDFLEVEDCPESFIITNPPFNQAEAFIRHASKLNPECGFAFLLKSQYWHSASRLKLFREIQPQFVLPLTWRPDFLFGAKSGSPTMEVLWTVWINKDWEECYEGECIYQPLEKPKPQDEPRLFDEWPTCIECGDNLTEEDSPDDGTDPFEKKCSTCTVVG